MSRYIRNINNRYQIYKSKGNKVHYWGSFDTLQEAEAYRDYLIEKNWDINLKIIKNKHNGSIWFNGYQYYIRHLHNNEIRYYGAFKDKTQAEQYLQQCRDSNWKITPFPKRTEKGRIDKLTIQGFSNKTGDHYTLKFKTEENANKEKELMKRFDWDINRLIEYDEAMGTLQ